MINGVSNMSVPAGFAILLKSMGVDPEQLKTTLTAARDEIMNHVNELKENDKRIERKLDLLMQDKSFVETITTDDDVELQQKGFVGALDRES